MNLAGKIDLSNISRVFMLGICTIYCPKCREKLKRKGLHPTAQHKLRPTGILHTYRCENCKQEYIVKGGKLIPIS
jgi:transposase-like protein